MSEILLKPHTESTVAVSIFKARLSVAVIETLPIQVQKVAAAKNSPVIVDYRIEELEDRLSNLIGGAYQDAGQVIEPRDLAALVYRLQRELVDYPFLHFAELELAVSNGVKGMYGKYFGINLVSIISWIGSYRTSEECKRYAHELSKVVTGRPEPSEEEKDQIGRTLAFKTLEDFKSGRDISLPALTVYDYLDRKKVIVFSKEQKIEFMNKAVESVKISLSHQADMSNNKQEINRLKARIADMAKLQNKEEGLTDAESAKALQINEAKRLALKSFFEDLIEFEQELLID